MVGDTRVEIDRDRRRVQRIDRTGRDPAKIEIEVLDLAGEVAAEVRLDAGAGRPTRLRSVVVEVDVDSGDVGIAVGVDRAEPRNRAGGLDLGDREAACEIRHGIRRDGRAKAAAHGSEPIQFLPPVEGRAHRRGVADHWTADRPGTNVGRRRVLGRKLNVGLEAGDEPTARHPIVAALETGDDAVDAVRGAGGEQRRAGARVAEHGIGLRFSGAVASVDPDIGAGPAPRRHDRRAVGRRLGFFGDERDADAGQIVSAEGGVEFVVDAGAHDVVGDVRARGERDGRRVEPVGERRRDRAEIHVEVLDLAGHVAEQAAFETRAHRPARLDRQHADRRGDHAGVAVGVETDAGQVHGGSDRADREAAGGIGHDIRRDGGAEAPAHGAEPIEVVALHEARRHRRIEADGRIADCAGTDIVRRCALPRLLNVGFETRNPIACLPIVSGLHAADYAPEVIR